jgi:solute carrier family 25 oxoglutarate transporter 11
MTYPGASRRSSFVSGAMASSIGNPFDVSLVRMQADSAKPVAERYGYKGVGDALTRYAGDGASNAAAATHMCHLATCHNLCLRVYLVPRWRSIVREEGFGALYRGYPPTLLRAIAMNVGQMTTCARPV